MNWKKILTASAIIWVVGIIFTFLTCGSLFQWVYTLPPNIWQPAEVLMTANNMLISNLWGFVNSFIFAWMFALLYKGIPYKGINKGICYGLIVWAVGALSGMATMPIYMTINTTVVVYWITQALVLNVIRGGIVAWVYERK